MGIINKKSFKILVIFFSFIMSLVFSTKVYAADIKATDITLIDKSSTAEVDTPVMVNNEITSKITLNKENDYAVFDLTIKNNEKNKYKIESIIDNNENEYITVNYDYSKDYFQEETKLKIKFLYKNKLINQEKVSMDNLVITIKLVNDKGESTNIIINNPKTGDSISLYIIIFILGILGLIYTKKKIDFKGIKVGISVLIFAILLLPFVIFALDRYEIPITFKRVEAKGEFEVYDVMVEGIGIRQVTYGNEIGELPEQPRDGYSFNGYENQNGVAVSSDTIVTEPMTVRPMYTAITYNITYDYNGGYAVNPDTYTVENTITLNNPTKKGYTFAGWTGSNGDTLQTEVTISSLTGNLNYVANYSANPDTAYKVIHRYPNLDGTYTEEVENLTGATDSSVRPQTKDKTGFTSPALQDIVINADGTSVLIYTYTRNNYNLTLTNPEDIESAFTSGSYPYETLITVKAKDKQGYTFSKWSDNETAKEYTFELVKDTELYPIYTPNTDTAYTVLHKKQNFDETYTLEETENLTGTTDAEVTPGVKTYTGFTSPQVQTVRIKPDGTLVVEYLYTRNRYTLNIEDKDKIEEDKSGEYYYGTEITVVAKDIPGYVFTGWENGGNTKVYTFTLTGDKTIKPLYTPGESTPYTVIHKKMNIDGTTYTVAETENLTGVTDTNVTPNTKTYTGFTSPSTQTVKIKGDGTTVVEYLYTRNQYSLVYVNNDNIDLPNSTTPGDYYYGTEITIKAKEIPGYTFKQWSTGETDNPLIVILEDNLVINPEYTPNKYNVIFNSNTGTGTMSNQQMTYDVETKLSKNTFTKTGYTFSKWNTKEDGTGTNYNDEATVKNLATSGNKILYAVWTANELVFNNQTLNTGTNGTAYTSNAFTGASNGTGDYKYTIKSGAPEGATINSTNRTISFPATTVAGTYNVVVTAKDNTSGKSKDATMKIVINTATPTVTLAPKSAVYTGSAIAANTATVSPNSNPTITYTYYNGTSCTGTALSGAPTNVGTYSVKAHAAAVTNKTNVADSACVAHTITQAPTTTTMSAVTKTYTGSAQAASGASAKLNSNNSSISGGSYTYTYYNGNSCSGTALSGAPITAGTYSVKATLTATTNYASSTSSCALYTMNKSATTTTMSAITKTYTGSAQAASGATSKLSSNNTAISGGSYTYTYYSGNSCSGTALTSVPTNAGTYSVKATLTGTTNYNESTSSCVTYTMNAKSVTLTAGTSSRAWNGSALTNNTCTANTGGLLSGHTVTCTMTSGSTITNVGSVDNVINTYTIKSGSTDLTSNYIVATTNGKLTITAATPTVTLTPKSAVYTGSAIAANTATVSPNSNPTITYTYYNGTSCTGTALSGAPTNVGTYSLKAHAAAVTNKTNVADSACVAHTITQAPTTTTMSAVTKTYTGSAQAASGASAKLNSNNTSISGGSYTYTYYNGNSCTGTALSGAPITAGTYSVKATLTATTNYASSTSGCVTYTMNKKAITIKAKDQTIDFGSTISKTTSDVTVTTLVSGDSLTGITLTQSTTNPTTSGKITPSAAVIKKGTTNVTSSYSITYTDGVLKINDNPDTITITNKVYIYDGSGKATTASATSGSTVSLTYYSDSSCSTKTTTTNATSAGGTPKAVGTYYAIGTTTASTNYTAGNSGCKKAVEINNAKLTFDATTNGGTLSGTETLYTRTGSNKVYTDIRNSIEGTIPTASKTNYIFIGWYTAGGVKVLNADGSFTGTDVNTYTSSNAWSLTSNRTLYAQYVESGAMFDSGPTVNRKIRILSGESTPISMYKNNTTIISVQRTTTRPDISTMTDDNIISSSNSPSPIYAWFDNGTIYYYSDEPDLYLNSYSSDLFRNLSKVETIDLSTIDTSRVSRMDRMFDNCKNLTTLDVSHFDTSNVTNMYSMFGSCESLSSLDVTHFDTSNVTNMNLMFYNCSSLTSIDVTHFDTSNVTNMYSMFEYCENLTTLDVTHFDTSKVINMASMFFDCKKLTTLDVSHFDTSNVTNMADMFASCKGLTTLDVTHFDTSKVTDMSRMFEHCENLTTLDVTHFDTGNVTDMRSMFENCSKLSTIDVTNFDTSNVTNMENMFSTCGSLTSLDVTHFDTGNVTDMSGMFEKSPLLTSLDLSHFNTINVTTMRDMFEECTGLTTIDLSGFNTSNVKDMYGMFNECNSLRTIYASNNFVTTSLDDSNSSSWWMFTNCNNIRGGSGTTYHHYTSQPQRQYAHVDGGTSNPGYFTYKASPTGAGGNISKVSNMIKNNGNKIVLFSSAILVIILGIVLKLVNRKKKS